MPTLPKVTTSSPSPLNSLTEIGAIKIRPYRELIAALPKGHPKTTARFQTYIPRLIEYLLDITATKL